MRVRRLFALLAVLGLVAGACGDRGEDTADDAPTDDTEEAEPAAGDFGELEGVCGPNEGGGEIPDAPDEELVGLTDDAIAVGTVADPGFESRPDLNIEMHDAAEAFVEWCNEAGGINGRPIDLTLRDSAFFEYQPVIDQACREDFAIVGSGAVQDNLWSEIGPDCGLVDIAGFSVTPEKVGLAGDDPVAIRSVQPVPNPQDEFPVIGAQILNEDFSGAGDNVAILFGDFDTTIVQAARTREAYESIGLDIVLEQSYNILGEANWAPFAAALRDNDVTWLSFVGEGDNLAQLQQAMEQVGYQPEVTLQDANFYDPDYLAAAGPAADGVFLRNSFWPFEEADDNPATRQYIDLVEERGGKVALLGAQGISGWLLFAQSVKACDLENDLTRACVLEEAASVTEWTGGGLHAPANPAANEGPECGIVLRVEDGEFTRYAPDDLDEGYACDPSFKAQLEGDYGIG